MTLFLIILSALIMGSFASCVSYRLGTSQGFVFTRSKCATCNSALGPINLIPLFSWILQRGKCGKCEIAISWRYPLIEIGFLMVFLALYFINGGQIDVRFGLLCLMATILMIITIVDLEHYFIPDLMQIALFAVCMAFVYEFRGFDGFLPAFYGGAVYALFGAGLYFLFLFLANVEAIGVDDIKILFIIGFVLTLSKFLPFIFLTGIFGIIFGGLWMKVKKDTTFPFAPSLCLAMFICLNLGEKFDFIKIISKLLF